VSRLTLRLYALLGTPLLLLAACSGGFASNPTQTPPAVAGAASPVLASPTPATAASPIRASPTPAGAAISTEPDGARILGYVKRLADDIGPRPAGSSAEQAAVDFIASELRAFGYEVSIQDFPVSNEAGRESKVSVSAPAQRAVSSLPFGRSASATVSGRLVAAGIGRPSEFPAAVAGNIALVERGELTFQEKVTNSIAAGARGVIIFNNQPGNFLGSLSQNSSIAAASVSQEDGQALVSALSAGAVDVQMSVGALGSAVAHNVIAKPPGKECETVTGGHFDSVQQAPGASDNATGTATTIEIARILARAGQMGSNCFVLWGAEEVGLVGSQAYVSSLTSEQRSRLKAVLNLDMVGVGDDTWLLIGSSSLQVQVQALADKLGIDSRRGALNGTSSDHASFISAGIPALMIHRREDPLLHTPQDVSARVRADLLEQAARLGIALLQSLAAGGG